MDSYEREVRRGDRSCQRRQHADLRDSWTPPTVDVSVARKVLAFVETRRVLFSTYSNEVPEECVASVRQIHEFLTTVAGDGGIAVQLLEPVRLMRRYCVRFLERVGATEVRADPTASNEPINAWNPVDRTWRS